MEAKKRRRRVLLILLLVLLAAAGGLYYYGYTKLTGVFLPNTSINGLDVSLMEPDPIDQDVTAVTTDQVLTIQTLDGEETIAYADIDYHMEWAATAASIQKLQNHLLWPLSFFQKSEIAVDASYTYSEDKLKAAVNSLDCISGENIKAPRDASVKKRKKGYVLSKSDDGNTLDQDAVQTLIQGAIESGSSNVNLDESGCYLKAAVQTDDEALQKAWKAVDKVQSLVITLDLYGSSIVLDKSVFLDWIVFNREEGYAYVSEKSIGEYVNKLAEKLDTYKKERQFKTHAGDTITIGGSDNDIYGFILQKEDTKKALLTAFEDGESTTVEAIWDRTGNKITPEGDDIQNTYIEISIDQQMMWYIKDGNVEIETPVVTGKYSEKKRRTPTGVFQLLGRLQDYTMTAYGTSHTNFAMPINHDGIYIHDSSWRDYYGGEIYLDNGSHGCINTPYNAAKAIYYSVDTNTPVIIYNRNEM
ncbi:MAG: L,D-transpeptidase family protein [Lachnospiraceae bacterium]|nr:L,D-transpeptidase family protein [Lachnospiraceae bacterium]